MEIWKEEDRKSSGEDVIENGMRWVGVSKEDVLSSVEVENQSSQSQIVGR